MMTLAARFCNFCNLVLSVSPRPSHHRAAIVEMRLNERLVYICMDASIVINDLTLFSAPLTDATFLGPVQTSNFSCAESNVNELSSLFELICIRFGT